QQVRDGIVIQYLAVAIAPPASQMQFVDRNRCVFRLAFFPPFEPTLVLPFVDNRTADDRRGLRRCLLREGERIGLQRHYFAIDADDLVFVERALRDAGNEYLPDADTHPLAHRVAPSIPGIEIA